MASSHLVADGDTTLAGDIDLDGLYDALLTGIILLVFLKLFLPALLRNLELLGEILEDFLDLRLLLHGLRIAARIEHIGVIALGQTRQHALGDLAVCRDDLFWFAGDKTQTKLYPFRNTGCGDTRNHASSDRPPRRRAEAHDNR